MTQKPTPASFASATQAFKTGADTPRDFLERCIARYEDCEPRIHAFVHVNLATARAAADAASERWRNGRPLSRIDGMPIGVKDILETANLPTEQGSKLFIGWQSTRDAATVAGAREAGAVVLGKTVTTEFAATEPGPTTNPWDHTRTPGGSSSGSAAAVASGVVSGALGTQVIGSIIRPSSYCGCVGFKPSLGGLNRGGSFDYLSQSCSGVLGATLDDVWLLAREISSRVGGDPGHPGLSGPSTTPDAKRPRAVALLETAGFASLSSGARAAFETIGARLKAADVEVVTRQTSSRIADVEEAIADAGALSRSINAWESRWPLNTYALDMDRNGLSAAMQARLAEAEQMNLEMYQSLLTLRANVRATYAALAAEVEACVTLAAPDVAPVGIGHTGDPSFAIPASLLGVPALSLPLFMLDGLPLGLQMIGFQNADANVFGHARAIEAAFAT